ncbi:MAG: F0F1 ATP synthase subunit A [Bacteroidia bacterium]
MASRKSLIFTILALLSFSFLQADEPAKEGGGQDPTEAILHHIQDSHDWHITDIPVTGEDGHTHMKPIALHLPWMFWSSRDGFVFASGTEALLEKGYAPVHEHLVPLKAGGEVHADEHGHVHMEEAEVEAVKDEEVSVIDISITKTSFQMILVGFMLVLVFTSVARSYTKREGQAPKGLQSFMEPVIVFVRDEVAKPNLGAKADAFMPYLLTLFFFIWFANLFGLTPLNSNIAGNISVTAALALLTFILTQVNASKDHWIHVFNTPGVPGWLKFGIPLMPAVEFLGLFTKPFALAVRLFANITAGHFMVLGLVSLIFIMGNGGTNFGGAMAIMPLSVLFTVAIFVLEMIVAIVQPFIFTLLTAVFIGMAMESHDDHH